MSERSTSELFCFSSDALPDEVFHVVRFRGTEGLNRLFCFTIDMVSPNRAIDGQKLLSHPARFVIHRKHNADAVFHGFPAGFRQGGFFHGYTFYTVELRPAFWKLSQIVQSKIFLNKTVKEAAEELLTGQQFFSLPHEFRFCHSDYPSPEFSMQFNESICDYLLWRMEEQGAYLYFAADGDRIIFADAPQSHDTIGETITYSPSSGLEGEHREEVVTSFTLVQSVLPRRVVVRSYDWKKPTRPVVGMADVWRDGTGDVYLTNETVESDQEATRIAKIRAEELISRSRVFSGVSAVPLLRPGYSFTLGSHYAESFNRDYMVTEVVHEGSQESFISLGLNISLEGVEDHLFYRNSFTCIPADCPYRPARTAPRAKIAGFIRAFVDGAGSGARPELDEYGRYKLIFPFDISGRSQGNASCWVRMSQPQVGRDNGMSFPLLPGAEVTVAFLDGNPDRPVITGSLPNGETAALTGQSNANLSGIRTPGGNQITINDSDTHQGISLQTPSGLGLTMSAGSLGATTEHSDLKIAITSVLGTEVANLGKSLVTGCKVQSMAAQDVYSWIIAGATALQNSLGGIFDSLSAKASQNKNLENAEISKWGSDIVKTVGLGLLNIIGTVRTWNAPSNKYGAALVGSKHNSAQTLQVWPGWGKTLGLILTWITGRIAQFSAEAVDTYKQVNAASESKAQDQMDKDLLQVTGDQQAPKNDDERKEMYTKATNELTLKIAETMANAMASAKAKADGDDNDDNGDNGDVAATVKELQAQLDALNKDYDVLYNDKSSSYYKYTKSEAIRRAMVSTTQDILPEITAIILQFKALSGQGGDHGGVGLCSPDRNINLNAKEPVSLHSQKGIFLDTKSTLENATSWGVKDENFFEKLGFSDWKMPDNSVVFTKDKKFISLRTDIEHHDVDRLLEKTGKAHRQSIQHWLSTPDNDVVLNLYSNTCSVQCKNDEGLITMSCASGDKKTMIQMNGGEITLCRGDNTKVSLLNDDTFVVKVKDSTLKLDKEGAFGISSSKGGTLDISDNVVIAPEKKTRIGDIEFSGTKITATSLNFNSGAIKITGGAASAIQSTIKNAASVIASKLKEQDERISALEKKEQASAEAQIQVKDAESTVLTVEQSAADTLLAAKLIMGN